jgi:hypothetical protein
VTARSFDGLSAPSREVIVRFLHFSLSGISRLL